MAKNDTASLSRRGLFRVSAGAVAAAAATAPVRAEDEFDYGDWFDDVPNFDGTVDRTGEDEVTVQVGTGSNGLAFDPPAIHVDPGTTVVFEWTGEGGAHNVAEAEPDERYQSDLTDAAGTTYTVTFESDGISKYVCTPHTAQGMKGAVAVGDGDGTPDVEVGEMAEGSAGGNDSDDGTGTGNGDDEPAESDADADPDDAAEVGIEENVLVLYGVAVILALLSPLALFVLMARHLQGDSENEP